ncbi:transposase [Azonexus sp.]|uniref:transposase n=1 Tax=Azonexus sp. TaxID=1872668 RepID=UPI0035AEBAB9
MAEQLSFISCRWPRAKAPKRAEALALIDRVIPWADLEEKLRPFYAADIRRTGRKGYGLKMMIRCWVLAYVWQLSDEGLENFILDSLAAAKFIGTDPWQPRPPSASAYRNFRYAVDRCGAADLRLAIDLAFTSAGLQWRQGMAIEPVFRRASQKSHSTDISDKGRPSHEH